MVDRQDDLELRVTVRLAGLAVRQVRELGDAAGDDAAPRQQVLGALAEVEGAPPVGGLAGPGDGGVDLGLGRDGVRADEVAVGGVERVERVDGASADGAAVGSSVAVIVTPASGGCG